MKNLKRYIYGAMMFVLLSFYTLVSSNAFEWKDLNGDWLGAKPDGAPTFSFSNAFLTKYIWRGQNLGNEPVIQNDAYVSWKGLTLDFWTNYSTNSKKGQDGTRYQEYTEIDYTADYTFKIGDLSDVSLGVLDPVSVSVGYTYYTFPNVDWDSKYFDSNEIYWGLAYDCLLKPYMKWYADVTQGTGSYIKGGISHTFTFDQGISAVLGGWIAYNYHQYTTESGMSDLNLNGAVNIPVFKYFTVSPNVNYSIILDRSTYGKAQSNEFYGGVTVSFTY